MVEHIERETQDRNNQAGSRPLGRRFSKPTPTAAPNAARSHQPRVSMPTRAEPAAASIVPTTPSSRASERRRRGFVAANTRAASQKARFLPPGPL